MKKIAILSVLMTYLVLNMGISMKVHYCGDAVSFVDFFPVSEKTCCGGKKKADCCSDKLTYVAPIANQENSSSVSFSFTDFAKYALVKQDFTFESLLSAHVTKNESPCTTEIFYAHKVPLYLRHNSLLI